MARERCGRALLGELRTPPPPNHHLDSSAKWTDPPQIVSKFWLRAVVVAFSKNGEWLGDAVAIPRSQGAGTAFFPHITVRNMTLTACFQGGEANHFLCWQVRRSLISLACFSYGTLQMVW